MTQVWLIDEDNFFTGESIFVEEVKENMTTVPYLVGYVKGKLVDGQWIEGATEEEIEEIKRQEEENTVPPQPTLEDKISICLDEIEKLNDSQMEQDFIIDDLIFEVIPMLEDQISINSSQPVQLVSTISNKLKGDSAMAAYLAKKIMDGRDYEAVFKTYSYKQYQDEVDTILELEGKGDLIKR